MQIFHPWTAWECYPAGMYDGHTDMDNDEAKRAYALFLSDIPRFTSAMERVIAEWPISCEHFLTNQNMNRIAWMGQAAMCINTGVSRKHRAGFMLLNSTQQVAANTAASIMIDKWTLEHEKSNRPIRYQLEITGLFDGHTG